eukprot:scaffold1747_cov392-Prasinococcus_capsulatus_cf.AAC.5
MKRCFPAWCWQTVRARHVVSHAGSTWSGLSSWVCMASRAVSPPTRLRAGPFIHVSEACQRTWGRRPSAEFILHAGASSQLTIYRSFQPPSAPYVVFALDGPLEAYLTIMLCYSDGPEYVPVSVSLGMLRWAPSQPSWTKGVSKDMLVPGFVRWKKHTPRPFSCVSGPGVAHSKHGNRQIVARLMPWLGVQAPRCPVGCLRHGASSLDHCQ